MNQINPQLLAMMLAQGPGAPGAQRQMQGNPPPGGGGEPVPPPVPPGTPTPPPPPPAPFLGGYQFMGELPGLTEDMIPKGKPNMVPSGAVNMGQPFYNFQGVPGMQPGIYTPNQNFHDS